MKIPVYTTMEQVRFTEPKKFSVKPVSKFQRVMWWLLIKSKCVKCTSDYADTIKAFSIDTSSMDNRIESEYAAYYNKYREYPKHIYVGLDDKRELCAILGKNTTYYHDFSFGINGEISFRNAEITIVPHMQGMLFI